METLFIESCPVSAEWVTQIGLGTFGDRESWPSWLVSCCCSAE